MVYDICKCLGSHALSLAQYKACKAVFWPRESSATPGSLQKGPYFLRPRCHADDRWQVTGMTDNDVYYQQLKRVNHAVRMSHVQWGAQLQRLGSGLVFFRLGLNPQSDSVVRLGRTVYTDTRFDCMGGTGLKCHSPCYKGLVVISHTGLVVISHTTCYEGLVVIMKVYILTVQ